MKDFMILMDGKALSKKILDRLAAAIQSTSSSPGLVVVLVGDDPASAIYVKNKHLACGKVGIRSSILRFPRDVSQSKLLGEIKKLNQDETVHGILIQLPLPEHMESEKVLSTVSEQKDVDGFHCMNAGKLFRGLPGLVPCTPKGVMQLLAEYRIPLRGKHAVVLGRSNIVGKPLAQLLLNKDATVTLCHRYTPDVGDFCRRADILVSAVGKPGFVKADWIKDDACVIDVGINRNSDGSLTGDVAFEEVSKKAKWITPVPGGVGPMTIAMLLENTVEAFTNQKS